MGEGKELIAKFHFQKRGDLLRKRVYREGSFIELLRYSNTLTFSFNCSCYIAWCLTSGGFVLGFLGDDVRKLTSLQ